MLAMTLPSELPIIQAPMAGGPSTPGLTAAVAGAGGFGILAAGYLTPDQLVTCITDTRGLSRAPFGVNIFCPSGPADPAPIRRFAELIRPEADHLGVALGDPLWDDDAFGDKVGVVASEHVPLVTFTFGCPDSSIVDQLHAADCRVAVTVTSAAEARHSEGVGVDLVVVQGTEAGGHQASFLDLAPNDRPLSSLLEEIRASVEVPLVGSGGIMSGGRAVEVLRSGAIGVQLGTAFLCCDEAGTSDTFRRALLDKTYADTILTRAFSGRYARGLANEFARRYSDTAPEGYPEIHHLTRPLRAAGTARGDPGTPNLWAGQGWGAVTSGPAGTIVRRIATEMAADPDPVRR
jgi:nitronate monooxygenase